MKLIELIQLDKCILLVKKSNRDLHVMIEHVMSNMPIETHSENIEKLVFTVNAEVKHHFRKNTSESLLYYEHNQYRISLCGKVRMDDVRTVANCIKCKKYKQKYQYKLYPPELIPLLLVNFLLFVL